MTAQELAKDDWRQSWLDTREQILVKVIYGVKKSEKKTLKLIIYWVLLSQPKTTTYFIKTVNKCANCENRGGTAKTAKTGKHLFLGSVAFLFLVSQRRYKALCPWVGAVRAVGAVHAVGSVFQFLQSPPPSGKTEIKVRKQKMKVWKQERPPPPTNG